MVVDISKAFPEVQSSISFWLSYLKQYNISLRPNNTDPNNNHNSKNNPRISIIFVGTQRDKIYSEYSHLPEQEQTIVVQNRIDEIESLSNDYIAKGLISDYSIVSGKKIQGIEGLIKRIDFFGNQIVKSEALLLPEAVGKIAELLKKLQNRSNNDNNNNNNNNSNQSLPLLVSRQQLEQHPDIKPFVYQDPKAPGIELALTLLKNVGEIVYQPTTQMICLKPQLLIKMMASFVCPELHLAMLFGEKMGISRIPKDAIFHYSDLEFRVKQIVQRYYPPTAPTATGPLLSIIKVILATLWMKKY